MPTELIAYQLTRYTGAVEGQPIEQTKLFDPTPEDYLKMRTLEAQWIQEARAARAAGKTFPSGPNEQHLFGQTTTTPKAEAEEASEPKPKQRRWEQ